jgi:RNA polymerase sigma factor (sigma-70 family)
VKRAEPDFEDWYRKEHDSLARVLNLSVLDSEVASEALAEAFSRAFQHWSRVRSIDYPAVWTYRVALNLARRRWRRSALELRLLRRLPVETERVSEGATPEVWRAVAQLPRRQREAIGLRYIADLSEKEVASVMGVSSGTVAATLSSARVRLSQTLIELREEEWT